MAPAPRLFIGKNQQLTGVSSVYTNVQSYFGHARYAIQAYFPFRDISSNWVLNKEVREMLEELGCQNAVFSGQMNAQLPTPYPSVAAFETALFKSPYPYSIWPTNFVPGYPQLVFMDASSFSCDSGALHIREVNQQRAENRRSIAREKGMANERWLSGGMTTTDCGTYSNKV